MDTNHENIAPLEEEEKKERKEKAFVTGKSRKNGKRKRSPLVIVVIFLLLCVMGFSAYKIIDQLLIYKKGQEAYERLRGDIIQEQGNQSPSTVFTTAWTVPASEPAPLPTRVPEGTNPAATMDASQSQASSRERPERQTEDLRGDITYDANATYAQSQVIPKFSVNFDNLKAQSQDAVAWLYGMDGMVNYPVVQGRDNDYYVHRLLDGREQFCGTLFVDCRNNFMQDDITYIYGHKMKDGTMFGHFGLYDTYNYYQSHPTFRMYTPDATYELQVITCVYTTINEPIIPNYANEWEFYQAVEGMRRRGTFQTAVEVEYGDHLVSLFTCAYYVENGRMFVLCKAVRVA